MGFDRTRIYYNAVFGALGGLLSWAIVGLVLRFQVERTFFLFVKDALQGVIVGACIGLALGLVEGVTVSRSGKRALRGGCLGAVIGVVAGPIGLILGEVIFLLAGGGVWPRAIGWAVFGLLLGLGEGLTARSSRKASYGMIGGLLGGLVGGATYERASLLLRSLTENRDLSVTVGGALGLVILGASIGSLMALTEDILRKAWLKGMHGPLEGRTLTITKQKTTLGRSDRCDILIPGDPQVAETHATITQTPKGFLLEAHDQQVLVDQKPAMQQILQSGSRIQLGRSVLVFFTGE